ncbi:SspB family protein [Lichenicoccus sp.]|uniref:SspB family protein n=1 Tax=Lichenicoccus sp. TaxID=2781899 RepID=UPI003D0CC03C
MSDEFDGDGPAGATGGEDDPGLPPSLLPYERWVEDAYRQVMVNALAFARDEGLPGQHHFYLTFLTAAPGVAIPDRLRAQYPQEMTIVLQHQFWDLKVDAADAVMSVGLSFGGIPSTLVIPFTAITGFADPQVRMVLRFTPPGDAAALVNAGSKPATSADRQPEPALVPAAEPADTEAAEPDATPQVVSLDAFRRRGPTGS